MLEGYASRKVADTAVKIAKETVAESYRNGLDHGRLLAGETTTPVRKWRPAKQRRT